MPGSIKRFGILGTGRITRRLVAELQTTPGATVTAIASREGERALRAAEQYGIAAGVAGYDTLLRREDVDAIYLALPPALHTEWAVAAAQAGKAILCEKPVGTCASDWQQLAKACQQHGVRWLDATGWLHHRRTADIAEKIAEGQLGKLQHVTTAVSFWEPFQTNDHRLDPALGGGCLLDLGWYAVGLAVWALGMPHEVYASAITRDGVPFRVTGLLQFAEQRTASIHCGYDIATRKWCEIAGDEASVVCDDFTRPWPEKPARYWLHDRAGNVAQHQFTGNQEQRMIETFLENDTLEAWHLQSHRTQTTLDGLSRSLASGKPEPIEASAATQDSEQAKASRQAAWPAKEPR